MTNFNYITINKVELPTVTIHCVQAPEDGELTNSQIIETAGKLLIVDTLQLKPHANELRSYANSLGKPIERVIITHIHPDHWMGSPSFSDCEIFALPEVIGGINAMADYFIGYHRSLHEANADEVIHSEKVLPTLPLEEGILEIDDIKLSLIKVLNTESLVNLLIEIPQENTLLAQDLIYHDAYAYFGDKTSDGEYCFDNWIATLTQLKQKGYKHVFPGHGIPTDSSVFDKQIEYLQFVHEKINEGLQGEDLLSQIINKYPEYKLQLTLHMSQYMLFVFQKG